MNHMPLYQLCFRFERTLMLTLELRFGQKQASVGASRNRRQ